MQMRTCSMAYLVALALSLPFGCGKSDDGDNDDAAGSAGSSGASTGGRGTGGNTNNGGSAPALTGCEGLTPASGEDCDDSGQVCPSELGSCVCTREGGQRVWECFEIGGGEGGSSGTPMGGAGPGGQGPGGQGPGAGGEGGAPEGTAGAPVGGANVDGAGGALGGAGGEGGV